LKCAFYFFDLFPFQINKFSWSSKTKSFAPF
jgi:hypothetical protein